MIKRDYNDIHRVFFAASLLLWGAWLLTILSFAHDTATSYIVIPMACLTMFNGVVGYFFYPKKVLKCINIIFVNICAHAVLMHFIELYISPGLNTVIVMHFVWGSIFFAIYWVLMFTKFRGRNDLYN